MSSTAPLAQIVCVRPNGKDPRTVVEMAPVAKQIEAIKGLKKWDQQAKRPVLELWSDSGERLNPKTGEPKSTTPTDEKNPTTPS